MARVITVTDDEIGTTARIEIDGHVVRRIEVSADADSGIPDHLLTALIPFIGLPAVQQPSNGQEAKFYEEDQLPEQVAAALDQGEKRLTAAPPRAAFVAPSPADVAARVGAAKQEKVVPEQRQPELETGDYVYKPGDTNYVTGLKRPTDEEFDEAIEEFGEDFGRLAEHFRAPRGNIHAWIQGYRSRKKKQAANKS